jgi:hypothetical protein
MTTPVSGHARPDRLSSWAGDPPDYLLGAELKRLGISALIIDQQLEGENTSSAAK